MSANESSANGTGSTSVCVEEPDDGTANNLEGPELDVSLDSGERKIFDNLLQLWKANTALCTLRCKINEILLNASNPLQMALKLVLSSADPVPFKQKSMSYVVMEILCSLVRQSLVVTDCDDNMRRTLFDVFKHKCPQPMCDDIAETFQLAVIKSSLTPELEGMLWEGQYVAAASWIIALRLVDDFEFVDVLLPLIAQNQVRLAIDYLNCTDSKEFRIKALQWLDSLLIKEQSVMVTCHESLKKHKHFKVVKDALGHKPLLKVVTRWVKLFNIDDSYIPNYKHSKTCSYSRYLYYTHKKGQMSGAAYRENVRDAMATKALQMSFVAYLTAERDFDGALEWCKIFEIPEAEYPANLREFLSNDGKKLPTSSTTRRPKDTQLQSAKRNFLQLELPPNRVIFVDTATQFQEMMRDLRVSRFAFFDSEWKMNIMGGLELCLLQLAMNDRVFVIDCTSKNITKNDWRSLGRKIFNNENVLKVGFAIGEDLVVLKDHLQIKLHTLTHFLDLQILWNHIKTLPKKVKFSYGFANSLRESLSDLTALCCGKRLNKTEQCSNWAQRPLRAEQLSYAALDAYCLSLIYDDMSKSLVSSGLDFDAELTRTLNSMTSRIGRRLAKAK